MRYVMALAFLCWIVLPLRGYAEPTTEPPPPPAPSHRESFPPQPAHEFSTNLLQHGNFDLPVVGRGDNHATTYPPGTTELVGWKVTGSIDICGLVAEHSRTVHLGGASSISQPVDLIDGMRYQLYFVATCAPAGFPNKTGVVHVAGQTFPFSVTKANGGMWFEKQFEFIGHGETVLEIVSTTGDSHGPYVGNLVLSPVAMAPAQPAQAVGIIDSIDGDLLVLDQEVVVSGQRLHLKNKFHLQKSTQVAAGFKPVARVRATLDFQLQPDGRRLIYQIGP